MVDMCGVIESDVCADEFISAIDELRARNQWVGWKSVQRGESAKGAKVPANPHRKGWASVDDRSTWGSHKQAEMAQERYDLDGVGFVLTDNDDYTGIDLDKCRNADTGVIEPWALEALSFAETYAEFSPSGTGIRMFARGKVARAIKSDIAHIEIYGSRRYLTVTGRHIEGTPLDIREAPKTLAALIARVEEISPKREEPEPSAVRPSTSASSSRASGAGERAWALKALEGTVADLAATVEGGRNHALNAAAHRLGRIVARGWLTEAEVRAGLEDACRANGLWKDDGPKGVRATLNSGLRSGLAKPHEDLPERENPDDDEAEAIGNMLAEGNMARSRGASGTGDAFKIDPETGEILGMPRADEAGRSNSNDNPAGGAQATARPLIKATPYSWPPSQSIPPREWIYGRHLIRGFVSATVAPGGVGKSSLLFAEAISMVSGRALLHGVAPLSPLNVWIWNGEDPLVELNRRVAATAKHYRLRQEDCQGRLFVDSGREMKLVIAETQKGGTVIFRPIVKAIKETIAEHRIDVVVIDPFVSSHRASENDNNAIDAIAREWADIADKTNCAIELVHHVRKVGDVEVTVEMARGASALISAARSARVLNPMAADKGKKAGVENRRGYFRVNYGKSNMSPSSDMAAWYHMQSVDLENRGPYQDGDSIDVVTQWKWPDPLEDVTAKDLQAVLQAVGAGRWRESPQAKDWVGRAVAEAMGLDVEDEQAKAKIKGLLKIWIKNGDLAAVEGKDEKRMDRKFVEVGSAPDG
jgi:hypothetical protein